MVVVAAKCKVKRTLLSVQFLIGLSVSSVSMIIAEAGGAPSAAFGNEKEKRSRVYR